MTSSREEEQMTLHTAPDDDSPVDEAGQVPREREKRPLNWRNIFSVRLWVVGFVLGGVAADFTGFWPLFYAVPILCVASSVKFASPLRCPHCGKSVKAGHEVCHHCGRQTTTEADLH